MEAGHLISLIQHCQCLFIFLIYTCGRDPGPFGCPSVTYFYLVIPEQLRTKGFKDTADPRAWPRSISASLPEGHLALWLSPRHTLQPKLVPARCRKRLSPNTSSHLSCPQPRLVGLSWRLSKGEWPVCLPSFFPLSLRNTWKVLRGSGRWLQRVLSVPPSHTQSIAVHLPR